MSDFTAIIRKGEIFVKRWNPESREHEEKKKSDQVLSDILQFPVILEETTFGQFFGLISKEQDFYERIFKASMYGHPLGPYVKEAALPAKESPDLDHVEVYWNAELYEGTLEIGAAFHGWGKWTQIEGIQDQPTEGGIGIEFTPLNEYTNVPLKLDTKTEVLELGTNKQPFKGDMGLTVYDVINAILFEITWAGDISQGRKLPWEKDEKSEQAA